MNIYNFLLNILTTLRPIFDPKSKVAFSIGEVDIAWYAVIILSGALTVAIFGYYHYGKRMGIGSDNVLTGVVFGLLFGILGARLYYVIFTASDGSIHYDNIIDVIDPRQGGLAIHGGVIGAMIFIVIYCKIKHIKILYLLEIVLPLILFAQVVGRWGNFMNQEAFGGLVQVEGLGEVSKTTVLSDSILQAQRNQLSRLLVPEFVINRMYITYSSAEGFICPGYYYPTFLFESVLNFIGFTAYMISRRFIKKILVGDGISFYLIWYGIVRFFIETMRTDPLMLGNTGIKVAELISIICIIAGILFIVLRRVFKYKMVSCYDALYKEGASLMEEGYHITEPFIFQGIIDKFKKNKGNNKNVKK